MKGLNCFHFEDLLDYCYAFEKPMIELFVLEILPLQTKQY